MITKPLDELYFVWLYNQVADQEIKDPSLTYWDILRKLFTTEFVWVVPNDANRSEDGKDLRSEFIHSCQLEDVDRAWIEFDCSVLELMVGLSRRLSFEAEGEPHYWFWQLMENIGLSSYTDARRLPKRKIDEILQRLLFRTYESNGNGGFFPLKYAEHDQREVELWYQLSAYVLEHED